MILSSGVVTFVGLAGLRSEECSCEPYPMVGGAVRPSRWAVFGRWFTVPVVTTQQSYLVCCMVQGWRLL
jgi:hypothetical protein